MRDSFARAMTRLAKEREDVCLLSGDIGNRMFDRYKEVAPTRFLNCGIAEANMMSMAAGMGICGLRPVVYTIAPFTTVRCLEQIRVGVGYHKSPVTIVGTGSGLSYAELGATHHSLEDVAIMSAIPGMQVCTPCDSIELEHQLRQAIEEGYPTYIRIGKKGEPDIVGKKGESRIGRANVIREGRKIMIICAGPIISEAIDAAKYMGRYDKDPGITSIGSIEPLDHKYLYDLIKRGYKQWITLEEHYLSGGLGTKVIEWLSENRINDVDVIRVGVKKKFIHGLGSQNDIRRQENIDSFALQEIMKSL